MTFTVEAVCQAHGLSRQAHYQYCTRQAKRQARGEAALAVVRTERNKHSRMGTRKLYHLHKERFQELGFGRDKLFDLLREKGLLVEPKRSRPSTTNSHHRLRTYQNLTIDYTTCRPNQVWVADLTYLETKEGFCYASLIMDAHSRKIVGHQLSDSLSLEGSLAALRKALAEAPPGQMQDLIHHSDRGVQYCSKLYTNELRKAGANVSMAAVGNPYENAQAERVIGTLKREYLLDSLFASDAEAEAALEEAIYLYNQERPHQALGYRTPAQVHTLVEETPEYAMAVN